MLLHFSKPDPLSFDWIKNIRKLCNVGWNKHTSISFAANQFMIERGITLKNITHDLKIPAIYEKLRVMIYKIFDASVTQSHTSVENVFCTTWWDVRFLALMQFLSLSQWVIHKISHRRLSFDVKLLVIVVFTEVRKYISPL